MSPFDSPRDPLSGCEECPRYGECLGPHDCLSTEDEDAYDEDKENDFMARRKLRAKLATNRKAIAEYEGKEE